MPKQKETRESVTEKTTPPDLFETWLEKQQAVEVRAKAGFSGDRKIGVSGREEVEIEHEIQKAEVKEFEREKAKRRKHE